MLKFIINNSKVVSYLCKIVRNGIMYVVRKMSGYYEAPFIKKIFAMYLRTYLHIMFNCL